MTSQLTMDNRRRRDPRLLAAPVWARNTLGSIEAPSFSPGTHHCSFEPSQSGHLLGTLASSSSTTAFRVPSPTASEEEEIQAAEARLAGSSELQLDRGSTPSLGKSSSVFETPPSVAEFTFRSPPPSAAMVVEREPPKSSLSPQKTIDNPSQSVLGTAHHQPEFGKASPLRSRVESNPFIIPKPRQPRPEHHRPEQSSQPLFNYLQNNPALNHAVVTGQPPQFPYYTSYNGPEVTEIPKPTNLPNWATKPAAAPLYSSKGGEATFTAVNPSAKPANLIDLTTGQPLLDDEFGSIDPYDYIDASKANENIKALLEGAFEDEEDKPRTRGRKQKVKAAVEHLTDKLQGLEVKSDVKNEIEMGPEEEEEEEDDGTVEGLKVKLLPHQVDGVAWMKDKEIGVKKKNGVLPKGGILADDVSHD